MMKFPERIKQLRESLQMPQRQLAAALEIDTATYCRIEKGERRAKGDQVVIIADILQSEKDDLLALWLADQVPTSVVDEKAIAEKAMDIVKRCMK